MSPTVATLLSLGYAYVTADMRGTGASYGSQMPLMPQLGRDGKELVDWIARQSWSDGNVGMTGQSYVGWSQLATASHAIDEVEHGRAVAAHHFAVHVFIARARPRHHLLVRRLGEIGKLTHTGDYGARASVGFSSTLTVTTQLLSQIDVTPVPRRGRRVGSSCCARRPGSSR